MQRECIIRVASRPIFSSVDENSLGSIEFLNFTCFCQIFCACMFHDYNMYHTWARSPIWGGRSPAGREFQERKFGKNRQIVAKLVKIVQNTRDFRWTILKIKGFRPKFFGFLPKILVGASGGLAQPTSPPIYSVSTAHVWCVSNTYIGKLTFEFAYAAYNSYA